MSEDLLGDKVRAADHALAALAQQFDFLLAVTPCNQEEAWQAFCAADRTITPRFRYREPSVDIATLRAQLEQLALAGLEDPTLAELLRDKRRELLLQLQLVADRDTPAFLQGSLQLYGPVDDALLAEAHAILAKLQRVERPVDDVVRSDASVVAERARLELAYYRARLPAFTAGIEVREDIAALTVSHGNLLIPSRLVLAPNRLDALLQHEVGTHIVTFVNGAQQPLRVLSIGLAGYEALQEGLAVVAEHVAGGFDADRMRQIAARVVAVRRVVEGVPFPAMVAELVEQHGFAPKSAFGIVVRVVRGGGLTKDAIYLRGLLDVLAYLRDDRDMAPLLVGKVAFAHAPLIATLIERRVLRAPALVPRWLEDDVHAARLAHVRTGVHPLDLVEGTA